MTQITFHFTAASFKLGLVTAVLAIAGCSGLMNRHSPDGEGFWGNRSPSGRAPQQKSPSG